ncbi:transporter substrate-binding domain-containing protein [Phyllobacterium endophyticum]|uniref:transporter substrate-binding domain-containing protein n=1 Tax=Phyllobacterium endophyticum TaxID=1149773 RepID=UPI001FEF6B84|nr:transporter substrate-binding domain-containing protein [Phyllobacterium endophyticum]
MFNFALSVSRARVLSGFAAILLATSYATTAGAVTPQEIKTKGTATIGVQMDQFPWGFIDQDGESEGFDIEIAKLIAEELGVKAKFERITGQNRIPLLVNGNVDFLVPSMTITEERAPGLSSMSYLIRRTTSRFGRKRMLPSRETRISAIMSSV